MQIRVPIYCKKCGEIIEPGSRLVVTREALWTDAGIFSLLHTREFLHCRCFGCLKDSKKK